MRLVGERGALAEKLRMLVGWRAVKGDVSRSWVSRRLLWLAVLIGLGVSSFGLREGGGGGTVVRPLWVLTAMLCT